jgi:hypothetical protein
MREQINFSVAEPSRVSARVAQRRENLKTCLVQPRMVCAIIWKSSQNTTPSADNAGNPKAEKKQKIRSQEQFVS